MTKIPQLETVQSCTIESAMSLIGKRLRFPFMLSTVGAFRMNYFVGLSVSVLLVSCYHIAMDMASFAQFHSECFNSTDLVHPMVQYIDYTYWNRALLSQEYVRDSLEFWR
jgi:hypothetical protein